MTQELLHRYIAGDVTSQEKELVAEWLDTDKENMSEFLALRKLYDISIWNQQKNVEERLSHTPNKLLRWGAGIIKIAAIFLIAFFIYRFFEPSIQSPDEIVQQTIFVPTGQRVELTLTDGTKVWLNARTTFIFPNRFDENSRNVTLDGEAYFIVKHDASKPFTVKTKQYDVNALGTEFNVRAYAGSDLFETSLLEGSVGISSHESKLKKILLPNTKAYQVDNGLEIASINDFNYFLWKDGIIYFDDETVAEMVAKLELYFDYKIHVKNNLLAKYRYSGKFNTKDGVEHVLKVLQLKHQFQYEKNDDNKIITIL